MKGSRQRGGPAVRHKPPMHGSGMFIVGRSAPAMEIGLTLRDLSPYEVLPVLQLQAPRSQAALLRRKPPSRKLRIHRRRPTVRDSAHDSRPSGLGYYVTL